MNYEEANTLKQKSQSLVGSKTDNGMVISHVLIVPSDEKSRDQFFGMSLWNGNFEGAILRFKDQDLSVWGIDLSYLKKYGVLVNKNIVS